MMFKANGRDVVLPSYFTTSPLFHSICSGLLLCLSERILVAQLQFRTSKFAIRMPRETSQMDLKIWRSAENDWEKTLVNDYFSWLQIFNQSSFSAQRAVHSSWKVLLHQPNSYCNSSSFCGPCTVLSEKYSGGCLFRLVGLCWISS